MVVDDRDLALLTLDTIGQLWVLIVKSFNK